jgi:hypothetical protein
MGPTQTSAAASGDKRLYLMGLKSMLAAMRARRPPDTPFGHTQLLRPHFARGVQPSKVGGVEASDVRAARPACTKPDAAC